MYKSKRNYTVVGKNGKEILNDENPLHPGYVIEMEIDARNLKKQDVALSLGIKPQHLSELLKEKRHVGAMLALKLEQVFGVDADYWLRVQSGYDLAVARRKISLNESKFIPISTSASSNFIPAFKSSQPPA